MTFAALEYCPNDVKALYRRCQALEMLGKKEDAYKDAMLGKKEDAYKDAMLLMQLDPKNKAVIPIMQRLSAYVMDKVKIVVYNNCH